MTDIAAVVSGGTAVFSAIAAGGSWLAARRANGAADAMRGIEEARRHSELMPKFSLNLVAGASGSQFVNLDLELVEPIELQRLESLTIRIRDDRPGRADEVAYPNPRHQIDMVAAIRRQVWGPFRFTPGVGPKVGATWNPADQDGRECPVTTPLDVGEALRFQLEPTHAPWLEDSQGPVPTGRLEDAWRQLVGNNIRLTITARAEGVEPWVIPMEVEAGTPVVAFG